MAEIFCILGKSASGKDSIYKKLLEDPTLDLTPVIPYTTRPMREGEREGVDYHFVDQRGMQDLIDAGRVIERRSYQTMCGEWSYFTADDGSIDLISHDYLLITTPEAYHKMRSYFGEKAVSDIYVWLDDGERLARALARERQQEEPRYAELCRRFLADQEDFSEERLRRAGISHRFENLDLEETKRQIAAFIRGQAAGSERRKLCGLRTSSDRKS